MGLCVFVKGGGGVYTNLGMGLCVFVRGVVCGNVLWGMCTIIFHFNPLCHFKLTLSNVHFISMDQSIDSY